MSELNVHFIHTYFFYSPGVHFRAKNTIYETTEQNNDKVENAKRATKRQISWLFTSAAEKLNEGLPAKDQIQ